MSPLSGQIVMTDILQHKLTMVASKERFVPILCISLVFILILVLVPFPSTVYAGTVQILGLLLFGSGLLTALFGLFTSKFNLVFDENGLEFGSPLQKRKYGWGSLKAVVVVGTRTGKRVFIEFVSPPDQSNVKTPFVRYLPETYGLEAEELAKIILDWQRRYWERSANN